ncbi:MAG: DUF4345 domain-containing protein [Pseudomonadota bacterium]|nr:DUF4345 domain-containing protein [Pseudomonadota bacterium]
MNLVRLRILLGVLGLVPIVIGIGGIASGLERLVPDGQFSSDSDGQYRYLSAIYLGFGGLILWIQSRLESEVQLFRILMTMVFVAGVARAIPIVALGFPRIPVLIALVFELIFPPFVLIWHAMALKDETSPLRPKL